MKESSKTRKSTEKAFTTLHQGNASKVFSGTIVNTEEEKFTSQMAHTRLKYGTKEERRID